MKYAVLAMTAAVLVAPVAAEAQGMWWVEGDRFCSDFGNRSRNGAMCGNARRGESEPRPTFRLDFNTPRLPFLEDQSNKLDSEAAPATKPGTAPRPQQ
ncbi:MAG: hypothetical protein KIT16_15165 [Rhodospirillaceae bacterium]|nr:hypothetical protein [Rhodospirillaceae bacterium]